MLLLLLLEGSEFFFFVIIEMCSNLHCLTQILLIFHYICFIEFVCLYSFVVQGHGQFTEQHDYVFQVPNQDVGSVLSFCN